MIEKLRLTNNKTLSYLKVRLTAYKTNQTSTLTCDSDISYLLTTTLNETQSSYTCTFFLENGSIYTGPHFFSIHFNMSNEKKNSSSDTYEIWTRPNSAASTIGYF